MTKGGFTLSRIFSVRTHVNFTRVNKIEAMCERPRVNVKVELQLLRLRVTLHAFVGFTLELQVM